MVQDGIRFCDVCDEEIPRGETYAYYLVPTPEGESRVDVCFDCRMNMHGRDLKSAVN
jgi:hypothetical protein